MAGQLRRLPEFRGRDLISGLILRGCPTPRGLFTGRFGPDLEFEVRYEEDGSLRELFFCQFEQPALVAILEAVLEPAGVFFDVGANIGIYSAWAARIVGPKGEVHAFEPVPSTRRYLQRLLELNRLENVQVVASAAGRDSGSIRLYHRPGASGLTSAVADGSPGIEELDVPVTRLDDYAAGLEGPPPQLLKIDVEGFELDVLHGARRILSSPHPPVVVFEAETVQLTRAGASFAEVVAWLEREIGYRVYALTPGGLIRASGAEEPRSLNFLALHLPAHERVLTRLRRRRFRRNQNC